MSDPQVLRSGENRPWPDGRVTAYVAGAQVAALLLGADGRALGGGAWVEATTPSRGGVHHLGGEVQGVTAALAEVAGGVEKVVVVAHGFGTAPVAQLLTTDGAVAFTIAPMQLSTEKALVMAEVYRREGAWKVRALAQGYAGGLSDLAAAYGAPAAAATAPPVPSGAGTTGAALTVEDPVRRIGMILDDASRTTASFESSAAFAERRLEQDLETIVGDPRLRMGPEGDAVRADAAVRRDRLVGEARTRHTADLAQLTAELAELDQVLPAALASWDGPAWAEGDLPGSAPAWAFRLGDLALVSAPDFRLPMVRTLPLAPAIWIETEDGGDAVASSMMSALAARLMVALPHAPRLTVVDVGGRAGLGHLPLSVPVATDLAAASEVVREHVEHLDLVALARRGGALDDLAPQHRPGRLLLVPDFPGALDDSSVGALHHLVLHGAEVGLSVVLSGRRPESLGIAVLDHTYDACLRVPTAPGGDLVDSYGGVSWVFHPDLGPLDPHVAHQVQTQVGRRAAQRDAT